MPEQLDAQISSKRFLSAVNILQDALRLIRRSDLEDIGALGDLRIYFGNQEMVSVTFAACRAITDLVVSSHWLIHWSKNCMIIFTWSPHTAKIDGSRITQKPKIHFYLKTGLHPCVCTSVLRLDLIVWIALANTWGRPLYQFLDTLDTSVPVGSLKYQVFGENAEFLIVCWGSGTESRG